MPNSAKHRSVSQQRSADSPPPRQHPGRRRAAKPKPSLGLAPAIAGVASLVAAAGGAVILQPGDGSATSASASGDSSGRSDSGTQAVASDITQARHAASQRSDRSNRTEAQQPASASSGGSAAKPAAGKHTASREAKEQAETKAELAAWEKKKVAERSDDVQSASAASESSNRQVISRNITFTKPVSGYRLSESFGSSGSMWSSDHTGQDFSAPSGTEIRAVGDGEIVEASYSGAYGNRTKLQLEDGTEIWFCHQSAFKVESGHVNAGDVIGYVGTTGNSTGPHLHLEVRPGGGGPIDPMPWLREHGIEM